MATDPTREGLPPFVTFESGARLLVALGIARHATGDTVRYIARTRKDWPFGDGERLPYIPVANARTMETGAFLAYFRKNPPQSDVRGPDKKPRARRARPS